MTVLTKKIAGFFSINDVTSLESLVLIELLPFMLLLLLLLPENSTRIGIA